MHVNKNLQYLKELPTTQSKLGNEKQNNIRFMLWKVEAVLSGEFNERYGDHREEKL